MTLSGRSPASSVFFSHEDTLLWHCSQAKRRSTALRAFSASGLVSLSSLRLVSLSSSKELGSRDPVAVEPSICQGRGQDRAGDLETLEAKFAPASNPATRAARTPKTCSIHVNLVVIVAIDWESVWTQLSNPDTLCVSNGSCASCKRISLTLSSNVLELAAHSFKVRSRMVRRTKI